MKPNRTRWSKEESLEMWHSLDRCDADGIAFSLEHGAYPHFKRDGLRESPTPLLFLMSKPVVSPDELGFVLNAADHLLKAGARMTDFEVVEGLEFCHPQLLDQVLSYHQKTITTGWMQKNAYLHGVVRRVLASNESQRVQAEALIGVLLKNEVPRCHYNAVLKERVEQEIWEEALIRYRVAFEKKELVKTLSLSDAAASVLFVRSVRKGL